MTAVNKSFPVKLRLFSSPTLFGKAERQRVLHDVNLTVQRGEIFGLLGANGAGKTTLLKLIATLLLPDDGTIRIAGIDTAAHPVEVKRRIGFAISDRGFYWRLSMRHNLRFFGTLCNLAPAALERRIREVVELVDLRAAMERPVGQFSSGMMQRLAVARALLGDPEILIFDEPTRAVDPVHALELRSFIRDTLAKSLRKTVLVSTNLLEEAWSLCDRVGILSSGRLAAVDTPRALASRYAEQRRFAISFAHLDEALPARLATLPGAHDVEIKRSPSGDVVLVSLDLQGRAMTDLMAAISANGSVVSGFRELDDALFDVFRATTENTGHG